MSKPVKHIKTQLSKHSKSAAIKVVVIGGGFAGLSFIKTIKNKNIQIVLIDQYNYHQFQPLLYQVATSGLEPDSIAFPFRKQIAKYTNVIFRYAKVEFINTKNNIIQTDKGNINYDYLVIATGSKTNFFGNAQIEHNAFGMKNIIDTLNIRHNMLQNLEQATITCDNAKKEALTKFIIVGGGPAGIEMAGALAEFKKYILPKDYPELSQNLMEIIIIEGSNNLLNSMSEKASIKALKYLKDLDVEIIFNDLVIDFDGVILKSKNGLHIATNNLIWTAGITGNLPKGIEKDSIDFGNRLKTNSFLQVNHLKNVFAIGDIALIKSNNYPKGHPQVAQTAIQQGELLAKNFDNIIQQKPLKEFKYKDKGSLATIGKKRAVADINNLHFSGYIAWILWSAVHLFSISGFRNKVFVGINWMISYFSYEKSNRLIIRNYKKTQSLN